MNSFLILLLNNKKANHLTNSIMNWYHIIFLSMIPISIFFSEELQVNEYAIMLVINIVTIINCWICIYNSKKISIGMIEILIIMLALTSVISCIINDRYLNKSLYQNLFLSIFFIITTKSVMHANFPIKMFHCFIILVNAYILYNTILPNNLLYANNWINLHCSNTGICAIFLSVSSIILLNCNKIRFFAITLIFLNLTLCVSLKCRTALFIFILYTIYLLHDKKKIKELILFTLALCFFLSFLLIKVDSLQGRLFILRRVFEIIFDNFLTGVGGFNTFPIVYPLYQANFFEKGNYSEKEYLLADNNIYAFNELLHFFCELGIIGMILFITLIVTCILVSRNGNLILRHIFICILLSSFTYYVFHIALFQGITLVILVYFCMKQNKIITIGKYFSKSIFVILSIACLVILFFFNIPKFKFANDITSRIEKKQSIRHLNNCIEKYFIDNRAFVNYWASELYHENNWAFIHVTGFLDNNLINSNIEYYKGKVYLKMGDIKKAERYFTFATYICPNRFRYKYELFKLYKSKGRIKEALSIAKEINEMPEKIPSVQTMIIKNEIKSFLEHYP